MSLATAPRDPAAIPGVWRGRTQLLQRAEATGCRALDQLLPGGGLPVGAVTELVCERHGIGEFGLLMPLLARLTREGRRVALVTPPYLPCAHGLAGSGVQLQHLILIRAGNPGDALWALDHALRSGSFGLAIAWPQRLADADLHRLQLAAETGAALALLYRPPRAAAQASPAALRIALAAHQGGLKIRILKNRGGQPAELLLPATAHTTRFRPTGTGWA